MIRRPPRSTQSRSSAASDVYKRQVEDGYIYLSGKLRWDYQRDTAKWALQNLLGVKGVVNNIEILPKAKPKNTEVQITKALERSAFLEAKGIRVQVDGTTVQLKGRVHSLWEKEEAEKTAYRAPGVRKVKNDIVVQLHPEFVRWVEKKSHKLT